MLLCRHLLFHTSTLRVNSSSIIVLLSFTHVEDVVVLLMNTFYRNRQWSKCEHPCCARASDLYSVSIKCVCFSLAERLIKQLTLCPALEDLTSTSF